MSILDVDRIDMENRRRRVQGLATCHYLGHVARLSLKMTKSVVCASTDTRHIPWDDCCFGISCEMHGMRDRRCALLLGFRSRWRSGFIFVGTGPL